MLYPHRDPTKIALVALTVLAMCLAAGHGQPLAAPPAPGGSTPDAGVPDGGIPIWHQDQRVDANQIDMFLSNAGIFGQDPEGPGPGLFYPSDTDKTCLFAAGLWIGGMAGEELRLSVSAIWGHEFQPGQILPGGGWTDPADPSYRVYKLTPGSGPGDPDYDEWPVDQGAPLGDDGLPLRAGDQTLFSVYHDANPDGHIALNGGTDPLGIEVRHLTYAYDLPTPVGRVIIMDLEIEHKGDQLLQDAFVGLALDTEIGFATDDVAGCDPDLEASFSYNGQDIDEIYGVTPPALGVTLLEGPADLHASVDWSPPEDPATARESYNYLWGMDRNGDPVIDPTTGLETTFWHSGDPMTGQGWLDNDPTDKRILLSVGPFDFAPGQTELVRVALLVGQGWSHIEGVQDLKQAVGSVRELNEKGAFPERERWALGGFYPDPFCLGPAPEAAGFVVAPRNGRIRAYVLGIGGGLVRRLGAQDVDAGIAAITWDGTDDNGQPVPPGDYRVLLHVFEFGSPFGAVSWDATKLTVDCIGGGEEPEFSEGPGATPGGSRGERLNPPGLRVPAVIKNGGWITLDVDPAPAFNADESDDAEISIFSVLGKRVRVFSLSQGSGSVWWDARDGQGQRLSSGLYLVRYARGTRTATGRVLLVH